MARSHVNHFSQHPYHITGRAHNRDAFSLPLESIWEIMSDNLFLAHHIYGLRIHSFVLMPNHFHLIASLTTHPLPIIMNRFMTETSREFNFKSGRVNQNWGGPHFKCEIPTYHYYINCYKYVYQNPVRAKLSTTVEAWPYSTLHPLTGQSKSIFPICEDTLLFGDVSLFKETLIWLNTPIQDQDLNSMKYALQRKSFRLPKTDQQKLNPLMHNKI